MCLLLPLQTLSVPQVYFADLISDLQVCAVANAVPVWGPYRFSDGGRVRSDDALTVL